MSRIRLLTVLLLTLSASVWAQDAAMPRTKNGPTDLATLIAPVKSPQTGETAEVRSEFDVRSSSMDVAYQLDGEQHSAKSPGDFRAICDCGCTVECLDKWCICEEACGTTNEYCPHPCDCSQGNNYLTPQGCWVTNDSQCDVWGDDDDYYNTAFRLGGWGVATQGSLNKIGEYQDLQSSPFWDLDGISSSGNRTLDFTLSGLDNEANHAQAYYYGPGLNARVRYDRYLRRLDHDPLQGFPRPTPPAAPGPNDNVIVEDLNVGEDYAIRVQQLDARFQGHLSENVKWRLNLWGMRKFGERQQNATGHCFNVRAPVAAGATGNVCHVLSQRQSIDWTTMEIQPVVEAQFENVTVEYSRTMRSFGQSDDDIFRQYTRFNFQLPAASGFLGPDYQSGIVPENFTQIDRVKILANVTESQQVYANMYVGDTHNDFRDTHRQFGGYDVRFIDRSIDTLTSTAYASMYDENNQLPPFYFNGAPFAPANGYDEASIRHPVDYNRVRAGLKGNWRPTVDPTTGVNWVGGYEYYELNRDYAVYPVNVPPGGTFAQPDTQSHLLEIGPTYRWSATRSSYVRYKARFFEDPLIGVREFNGRFNSNQPEQDHRIELGGTWSPASNFTATAQVSLVNTWHYSEFANFSEDSYPFYLTLWYAPSDRLSLTGGYAYFSNWIDQDITLGFQNENGAGPTETTRWNYNGENHLVSLNANYAWSATVNLIAGYEWNRGSNVFSVPASPAGADWSLLPSIADVVIETQRATLGADWQPYDHLTLFARYVFFDWNDISGGVPTPPAGWYNGNDSGVAHMALGGATLIW